MGYIIQVTCKHCNQSEQFLIGHGLRDFRLSDVISNFHSNLQEQMPQISPGAIWSFDRKLGLCNTCRKLLQVSTLSLLSSENQKMIIDTCSCGNIPKILLDAESFENDTVTVPCGSCSEATKVTIVGNWD